MTLITFQGGQVLMIAGKVGAGNECCCDGPPPPCPEGCPDLSGCTVTIVRQYPDFDDSENLGPASDYLIPSLCIFEVVDEDQTCEGFPGEISVSYSVEYDSECNPILTNRAQLPVGSEVCVTTILVLDCNPLP